MKKILKSVKVITLAIVTLLIFTQKAYAAGNPYPKYQESPFGGQIISCTWYAWQQAHDRMGVDLPLWTYVQTWYSKASKAGYTVGKAPKANSIMVWDYGEGFGGHAAYVTAVDGENITFDEGGSPMTKDGIYTGNQFTMDDMSSFLVGFIYLDVPRKVEEKPANNNSNDSNNNGSNANSNKTETPKPVVKSDDNTLSNLSIEGLEFEFVKDKLEYQLEVEYELKEIEINAIANDNKASIEGNDIYQLNVGENNFVVKVTAENGSVKEYKISIIRKEEKIPEVNELPKEENKAESSQNINVDNDNSNIVLIITGISLIIVLLIGFIFFRLRIKSKKIKRSRE